MKYRKKPVVVDVSDPWYKLGDNPDVIQYPYDAIDHSISHLCERCKLPLECHGWVKTFEGGHIVCPKDRIITGIQGEKYPIKPDIFLDTYEKDDRPKIVCFCGSSRFVALMACLMWEEEKKGNIALGLHLLPANYPGVAEDHQAEHEGIAAKMDELHRRKIDLADEIFVVNQGGYVGDSTAKEIYYAHTKKKPIRWLEPKSVPLFIEDLQNGAYSEYSNASNSCEAMN